MKIPRDSNGNRLTRDIRREGAGWGVNVWFGGWNGLGTNLRRYVYRTKRQAQNGDISDGVGSSGRIA